MKAIDYIRKGWTKGLFARTKKGKNCCVNSRTAAKWCAVGAINAAYPVQARSEARNRLLKAIKESTNYSSIVTWNDAPKRTKKQVIEAFKKAGI